MSTQSDDIIIKGIRNRDNGAFKYIQVKFQDSIRLMVLEMGGRPEDAKDVFNEGIIALIRLVDRDDFKLTCKLGTLLYALCNNKWKQQIEKQTSARNYHLRKPEADEEHDFTEDADQDLYKRVFWENFEKLDSVCRKILKGYYKDMSPREIAELLGYSYGYVRKRKSLCQSYLIKMIEDHPEYIMIMKIRSKVAAE